MTMFYRNYFSNLLFSTSSTKFWFINQQIEATFRSFNLLYPDNLVGRGIADERVHPIVYYDHRFANYLSQLLDVKVPFLGLTPRTRTYYFLVGLFLRVLWAIGTRWQLVPVLRVDLRYIRSPLFFKSFYTTLTPLSLLIQIYYRFKFHFQPPTLLHWRLNPYFFLYAPKLADQETMIDQPMREHTLFTEYVCIVFGSPWGYSFTNFIKVVTAIVLLPYLLVSPLVVRQSVRWKLSVQRRLIPGIRLMFHSSRLEFFNFLNDFDNSGDDQRADPLADVTNWPMPIVFFQRKLIRKFGSDLYCPLWYPSSFPPIAKASLRYPTLHPFLRLLFGLDRFEEWPEEGWYRPSEHPLYKRAMRYHIRGVAQLARTYLRWDRTHLWPSVYTIKELFTGITNLTRERGFNAERKDSRFLYQLARDQSVWNAHVLRLRPVSPNTVTQPLLFTKPVPALITDLRNNLQPLPLYRALTQSWVAKKRVLKRKRMSKEDKKKELRSLIFHRAAEMNRLLSAYPFLQKYRGRLRYFRSRYFPIVFYRGALIGVQGLISRCFLRPVTVLLTLIVGPLFLPSNNYAQKVDLRRVLLYMGNLLYRRLFNPLLNRFPVWLRELLTFRYVFLLFQSALAFAKNRLRSGILYRTVHQRYFTAKWAFEKMHNFGLFTNWALADDGEADTPADLILGEADVYYEADENYDSDDASLDNIDNAFPHSFLEGSNDLGTDDYDDYESLDFTDQNPHLTTSDQTRLLDRLPPSDFFQTDAHDREAQLTTTLFFHLFFPSFHHFFHRTQYTHARADFLASHEEFTEEAHYSEIHFPLVTEDTEIPVSGARGVELVEWASAYQKELTKWSKQQSPLARLPEFLRGSGSGLLNTAALQRLTGAEWRELTQFAAFLTTGVETKSNAQITTRQEADLIWERFAARLEQAPDVVFRRVMGAPRIPGVFEHTVLYPRVSTIFAQPLFVKLFRFVLGPNYAAAPTFQYLRFAAIRGAVKWRDWQHRFRGDVRGLRLLQLYAEQYIDANALTDQFARLPHSPYLFLAVSRYLRNFAADDFARFRAVANRELPSSLFLILFRLTAVAHLPTPRPPQRPPLRRFFFEPSLRTFYDVLIAFRERRIRAHLAPGFFGTRFTDELSAPLRGDQGRLLIPFFFLANRFLSFLPVKRSVEDSTSQKKPGTAHGRLGRLRAFAFRHAPRFLQQAIPKLRRTPVGPVPIAVGDRAFVPGLRDVSRHNWLSVYDRFAYLTRGGFLRETLFNVDWLLSRERRVKRRRKAMFRDNARSLISHFKFQEGWWRANAPVNDFRAWGYLTPFWEASKNFLYDPFIVDLALPPQFGWLHLEPLWSWDTEDIDDLDLYDEPLIYDETGTFEGDEEVSYISAYDGQLFEQDPDNAPFEFGEHIASHPLDHWLVEEDPQDDFDNVGDDYMEEEAEDDDQDLPAFYEQAGVRPNRYPVSTTEEYNDWFYEFDESVIGFEFWDEEEWQPDELSLAEDSSIPLSRLFWGGLRLPGRFPATDPRLFLGPISKTPRDTSLHFRTRLKKARISAETTALAVLPSSISQPPLPTSTFSLFVRAPFVSALIRILVYVYMAIRDLIYTYIFLDLQMRPSYQHARLGFAAVQHYMRWAPLYGNKFHMQRFTGFVVDWLEDFERYLKKSTRRESFADYYFFSYHFPRVYHSSRTRVYDRFFAAWPLANLWYKMDRAQPLKFDLPGEYYEGFEEFGGDHSTRRWNSKARRYTNRFRGQVFDTPVVLDTDEFRLTLGPVWRPRLGQNMKPNLPARQVYYDREFFGYYRDVPTQHTTSSLMEYLDLTGPDIVDLENTFSDSSPLLASPEPAEFMKQDDSLFFSFSLNVDFETHVNEFASRLGILHAAFVDLWHICRDYTNYGCRLGFNYVITGPLYFWAIYADRFWLRLSIRMGWWVNLVRYFLAFSFCFGLFGYFVFLMPRLTYYWLGSVLTSHVLLFALNILVPLFVLLGSLYLFFTPVHVYFNSLSRFEWHGWVALILFILFDQSIFGYERHGSPSFWTAVNWDEHPLMYTVEGDTLPFPARSSPSHMYDGPNPYLESTQTAYFTQAAAVLFDLNQIGYYGRQRRPEHLARWGLDVEGYKGHNDLDFFNHRHLALNSIYDLFYFLKLYILKLKQHSFVGWKWTWQSDTDEEAMDAIIDEPYAVFHRMDSLMNMSMPNQTHEEYLLTALPPMLEQNTASPFLYPFWPEFGTSADGWYSRLNSPSPFSSRHRRYHQAEEFRSVDPMPYDFRVKSFDHFFQPYVGHLGYPGRQGSSYTMVAPRSKNYFIRIPSFRQMTETPLTTPKPWNDQATGRNFFSWGPSQWVGGALEDTYAENEDWDGVFMPPDTPIPGKESLLTQRRRQPARFYKRNFGIYEYGDWSYRRSLLLSAYSMRRFSPERLADLHQYYHFARAQTGSQYFMDLYAKNLRDYLLYYKPTRAYAYRDIYGLSPALRLALRGARQFDLLVSNPGYGGRFNDFSRWAPYGSSQRATSQDFSLDNRYLTGVHTSERADHIRGLFQEGYGLKQQSTSLARYAYSSYLDLEHALGWDQLKHKSPFHLVHSRAERDHLLAVARTLRSAQLYDRLMRLNTNFANFYLHRRTFAGPYDPRSALEWVLRFEASLAPVVSKAPDRWILDPLIRPEFHETGWIASHLSDAFHAPAMGPAANRRVGLNFSSALNSGRAGYDPLQLYNLGRTHPLYAFPPGSHGHSRRFSFFFDLPDVYGSPYSRWAEDYILDDFPESVPASTAFAHEDRLDSFLNAVPASTDYKDSTVYTDRLREFLAGYPIFLFDETDMFDYIPVVYDSFSPESLRELRAHNRVFDTFWTDNMFPKEKYIFDSDELRRPLYSAPETGVSRQPTPVGIRSTSSRHFQFQIFADFLSTIADHNRVQSLDQVYFQDFLTLAKRGRLLLSDVLATGMGESERAAAVRRLAYKAGTADANGKDSYPFAYEAPPASLRRLKRFSGRNYGRLVRFYADDVHYQNRWGRYSPKAPSASAPASLPFAGREIAVLPLPLEEFDEYTVADSRLEAAARSAEVTAGSEGYAPFAMRMTEIEGGDVPMDHGNFMYAESDQFQTDMERYLKLSLLDEREVRQKQRFLEMRKQQLETSDRTTLK